jgi:hypothetical protein
MTEQELIKEISDRLTLLDSLMKSPWREVKEGVKV